MSYSSQQQLKKTIAARLKAAGSELGGQLGAQVVRQLGGQPGNRQAAAPPPRGGPVGRRPRRCHPHSSRHSRGRKFIPCRTACPVHRICTVQVKQDLREYLAAWIQKY